MPAYITCPSCGWNRWLVIGVVPPPCICGDIITDNVLYTTRFTCAVPRATPLTMHRFTIATIVLCGEPVAALRAAETYLHTRDDDDGRVVSLKCDGTHIVYAPPDIVRPRLPYGPLGATCFFFTAFYGANTRCRSFVITTRRDVLYPRLFEGVHSLVRRGPAEYVLTWRRRVTIMRTIAVCVLNAVLPSIVSIAPLFHAPPFSPSEDII